MMQVFLIGVCVVFLMFLPFRWRFALAMVSSVLQLYFFPLHDTFFSLSFLAAYSLSLDVMRRSVFYFRMPLFQIFLGLIVIQVVSFLWSSDLRLGVRTIMFELPFLFIAGAAYKLFNENKQFLINVIGVVVVFVLIEAFLVILFRVNPDYETLYWDSMMAKWFANPNLMDAFLDGGERNNSYDPVKSGGVFVNANVAASYLLMSSFYAFFRGSFSEKWFYYVVGSILWSSVLFTGSKAGLVLAFVFFPGFMYLFIRHMRVEFLRSSFVLGLGGVLSIVLLFGVLESSMSQSGIKVDALIEGGEDNASVLESSMSQSGITADALIEDGKNNFGIRIKLWRYGMMRFVDKPLHGFGFGGWQEEYKEYAKKAGLMETFPPHNTFVMLWSQSGVFAVVVGVVFIGYLLYVGFCLIKSERFSNRIYGVVMLFVVGVIFVHGMVENFGLLGEERQLPLFAAIVGITYSVFQNYLPEIEK